MSIDSCEHPTSSFRIVFTFWYENEWKPQALVINSQMTWRLISRRYREIQTSNWIIRELVADSFVVLFHMLVMSPIVFIVYYGARQKKVKTKKEKSVQIKTLKINYLIPAPAIIHADKTRLIILCYTQLRQVYFRGRFWTQRMNWIVRQHDSFLLRVR